MSPTARSLAQLREWGCEAQVVERYNRFAKRRIDLFGVIDIVALYPTNIVGIQACAGSSHAARMSKIRSEPRVAMWLAAGGRLQVWSWSKRGARGKRKKWTLRVEEVANGRSMGL